MLLDQFFFTFILLIKILTGAPEKLTLTTLISSPNNGSLIGQTFFITIEVYPYQIQHFNIQSYSNVGYQILNNNKVVDESGDIETMIFSAILGEGVVLPGWNTFQVVTKLNGEMFPSNKCKLFSYSKGNYTNHFSRLSHLADQISSRHNNGIFFT